MIDLDPTLLSRIQFAFTITAHIIFPAFSIGLATFLAVMEGLWLKTGDKKYYQICRFWIKIFALTFGMGVVSGVVVEFQLGTNWGGFAEKVGNVLGGLFTYEVLTAFFIEAGFLGVMLFGWNKVNPRLHYTATLLVFIGVTISAFWILVANSWMQTPDGYIIENDRYIIDDWWKVVFNPSALTRFIHMILAAYISTAFIIAGVSGWYLLKKNPAYDDFAKTCFSFAMWVGIILVPIQIYVGDDVGRKIHEYQPIKTAAMEAVWDTQKGAPLVLFAYPDQKLQKNLWEISIPHLAALVNTHQWNGELIGLKTVPISDQPVVASVFYSFRVMVGFGLLMLLVAMIGLYLRIRHKLYTSEWFSKLCMLSGPSGIIALWAGWFVAEQGRQPWVVYGLIRTIDASSPVNPKHILTTLILLIVVYGVIFGFFYFLYVIKILKQGPDDYSHELHENVFGYFNTMADEERK